MAVRQITDEQRKELTLFLGECWHEYDDRGVVYLPTGGGYAGRCKTCGQYYKEDELRTFTAPDDMVALAKRMVEKGVWPEFIDHAALLHDHNREREHKTTGYFFIAWFLTDPARFCWLVSGFLTKTEVKGSGTYCAEIGNNVYGEKQGEVLC